MLENSVVQGFFRARAAGVNLDQFQPSPEKLRRSY